MKKIILWLQHTAKLAATCFFTPWKFIHAPGATLKEKILYLVRQELLSHKSPRHAAASISCGILCGLLPIQGFQTASTIALSVIFRLNKILALLGVCISSPPLVPVWIGLGYAIGSAIVPEQLLTPVAHHLLKLKVIWPFSLFIHQSVTAVILTGFVKWFCGSIVMALTISFTSFFAFLLIFQRYAQLKKKGTTTDKREKFFDHLARAYDLEQNMFYLIRGWEIRRVKRHLTPMLKKNMAILEIGAGTGRFTELIAPHVRQMVALDISKKMLEYLSDKMKRLGIVNVLSLHGDMAAYLPTQQFDAVVSFSAIEYVGDQGALFKQIGTMVKPGGFIYITTAHDTILRKIVRVGNSLATGVSLRASSKKELTEILAQSGFDQISLSDFFVKTPVSGGLIIEIAAIKKNP